MTRKKNPRVAFYLRTSHAERTTANQRRQLNEAAKSRGWTDVTVFVDETVSGATNGSDRPAMSEMLDAVFAGKFDVVMAVALDRLGRSTADVLGTVERIESAGATLVLIREAFDTSTPTGKAMLTMMAAFAELERGLIKERVHAGLDRARAQGKRLGRPPVEGVKRREITRRLKAGEGVRAIARAMKVSPALVSKVKNADAA